MAVEVKPLCAIDLSNSVLVSLIDIEDASKTSKCGTTSFDESGPDIGFSSKAAKVSDWKIKMIRWKSNQET